MTQNVGYPPEHWYSPVANLVGSTLNSINPFNYLRHNNDATANSQSLDGTVQGDYAKPSGGFHFNKYVVGGAITSLLLLGGVAGYSVYGSNGSTPPTNTQSITSPSATATPQPSATPPPTLENKVNQTTIASGTPPPQNTKGYDHKDTQVLIKEIYAAGSSATPEQIFNWTKIGLQLGYNAELENSTAYEYSMSGDYKKAKETRTVANQMEKDAEGIIRAVSSDVALSNFDLDKMVAFDVPCHEWLGGEMSQKEINDLRKSWEEDFPQFYAKTSISKRDKEDALFIGTEQSCLGKTPKNK